MNKSLDEVLATSLADRRRRVEARGAELTAEETARLGDLGALLAEFDPGKHRRDPILDGASVGTETRARAAYGEDFCAWAAEQAAALQMGQPYSADLTNVAEEIEGLGWSRRDRLAGHVATIVEHLMKLEASPAAHPRAGWGATVMRARDGARDVLEESPSLRPQVPRIVARETERARRYVAAELADYGESPARLGKLVYDEEQVLGDWLLER